MPRRTGLLYDPICLEHHTPNGHPERPERVQAVMDGLMSSNLWPLPLHSGAEPVKTETLLLIHPQSYLDSITRKVRSGGGYLDAGDTVVSSGSWDAAKMAAGIGIGAVDRVMNGECDSAFAVVRPPGHHASAANAMGFCVLNNAAIAAAHAAVHYGLSRILLVDFDVHHGNGTQDIFYRSNSILYFSVHQSPAYPGTGQIHEIGEGRGKGYTVNVPLPPGVGDQGVCDTFDRILTPIADRFQPQLVLVSAGYDAHWCSSEYVAGIRQQMTVDGFRALSDRLLAIADRHCPGRLAAILEGGYDLESLSLGVQATISSWMGAAPAIDTIGPPPVQVPEPDVSDILKYAAELHHV